MIKSEFEVEAVEALLPSLLFFPVFVEEFGVGFFSAFGGLIIDAFCVESVTFDGFLAVWFFSVGLTVA